MIPFISSKAMMVIHRAKLRGTVNRDPSPHPEHVYSSPGFDTTTTSQGALNRFHCIHTGKKRGWVHEEATDIVCLAQVHHDFPSQTVVSPRDRSYRPFSLPHISRRKTRGRCRVCAEGRGDGEDVFHTPRTYSPHPLTRAAGRITSCVFVGIDFPLHTAAIVFRAFPHVPPLVFAAALQISTIICADNSHLIAHMPGSAVGEKDASEMGDNGCGLLLHTGW